MFITSTTELYLRNNIHTPGVEIAQRALTKVKKRISWPNPLPWSVGNLGSGRFGQVVDEQDLPRAVVGSSPSSVGMLDEKMLQGNLKQKKDVLIR